MYVHVFEFVAEFILAHCVRTRLSLCVCMCVCVCLRACICACLWSSKWCMHFEQITFYHYLPLTVGPGVLFVSVQ